MLKKVLTALLGLVICQSLMACAAFPGPDASSQTVGAGENSAVGTYTGDLEETSGQEGEPEVLCTLRITAEDTVLQGILYDNGTARGFAGMLPLTVDLWHPAPDFARAFDLPDDIGVSAAPGRDYELGTLAYWEDGPSVALIYKASREETVVPVVPIGKITSDVSFFEEYGGTITIEIEEDEEMTESGNGAEYTADTKVWDVIDDPVFEEYGRLIFPADRSIDSDLTLGEVGDILIWYNYVNPDRTVEIANYLREHAAAGEQIFYDIYTEEEKAADPAKEDTGLFFFRGTPGEKFAVVNAGGGFAYVAAMHDSFPHALELSRKGYNAFALIYRPGAQTACEDLARAIAFIHEHARELDVDVTDYSLWGGSAGARMAAWLGSYGTAAFGEADYPAPGAVIMQYTGLSEVTGEEPPTYACVGTSDGIAYYETMERRISDIQASGTNAEIQVFEGLPHGFGLGEGTVAEGWLDHAVEFWEENMESGKGAIPMELEYIPQGYEQPAEHQGTLEELVYQTYESFSYEEHSRPIIKTAWVYVPYGYSEEEKYNVFYLSHGGWSNETTIMGTPDSPHSFKHIMDHAIEDGRIRPLIIVLPTYNNTSSSDSGSYSLALQLTDNFHNELVNDLIPAVESKYSTYAESTDAEGLAASRDHRGFGGFSMGSVNTWHTFQYCLDYFRYFLPMSGSFTSDGEYMADIVRGSGHTAEDFFIFAASGTDDFAYSAFKRQIIAMGNVADGTFTLAGDGREGNLLFLEREGYVHDGTASDEYTYNRLRFFWNSEKGD